MVYRGKPSAGCENCRKAKKRCGLEQPACARCVKLKKSCSGYRDTTQLQIQDESEAVKLKAERHKAKPAPLPVPGPSAFRIQNGISTSVSTTHTPLSETLVFSSDTIELPIHGVNTALTKTNGAALSPSSDEDRDQKVLRCARNFELPSVLKPNADQVSTVYFFSQFTSENGHWQFLREYQRSPKVDPLLDLAIKACGIAALDNVRGLVKGREHSRVLYAQALGMLNAALRDPRRCRTDENLIAVAILGYFENLTCDSRESILSWKAHINGAAQLLKIRGKRQMRSPIGRILFRETRAQILIACMWDNLDPPAFLWEWNDELTSRSGDLNEFIEPADNLSLICRDFAKLRHRIRTQTVSDQEGFQAANDIEMRMIQWSINTMSGHQSWRYRDLEVPDSPHVWNGLVHAYEGHPAASVWDTYRSVRIMITRSQELLCRRLHLRPDQEAAQIAYLKGVRRQMTDDICHAIPCQLGHASPAYNSPNILVTAYGSVLPLLFAGTCALERVDAGTWTTILKQNPLNISTGASLALSQTLWIIGRMEHISKVVGLKWADSSAATLRGDFEVYQDILPEYEEADGKFVKAFWEQKIAEQQQNELPDWSKKIKDSGRGREF